VLIANTIDLGSDLGAMAAALNPPLPGPTMLYVALFGGIPALLEIFISYERYTRILKWSALWLLSPDILVPFVAQFSPAKRRWWRNWCRTGFDRETVMAVIAALGTTISPYLFFWQAGQEVEEKSTAPRPSVARFRAAGPGLARMRTDTLLGMGLPSVTALSIVIATAAMLHAHGITDHLGRSGCQRAAPDCRRLRLPAVCRGHHRHRAAGGARAGRLCR